MTLKFQFEPNQEHQMDGIAALVDVFKGQQQRAVSMAPVLGGELIGALPGLEASENGIGNWLYLTEEQLQENVRKIQERNHIADATSRDPLHRWVVTDPVLGEERDCYQFTVEMETGTGKTYVFVRSIMELAERYGYRKFVIVVPSIAIREGALKNLSQLKEHLSSIYKTPMEYFVYDSKNVSRLREFALSDSVQLMVINVQAFIKDVGYDEAPDAEARSGSVHVIYKPSDALSGRRPIDFVHAARPVVIIDEPQSVDGTAKSKEAIQRLNPMFIVRYSATHRERYNLLYVLDPVKAFQLRLVKQIWVSAVTSSDGGNNAVVELKSVDKKKLTARLKINRKSDEQVVEREVAVALGDDLFEKSNELPAYEEGYQVAEVSVDPSASFVRFANGVRVALGQHVGGDIEDLWRVQIEKTVEHHFNKVLEIQRRELKVKVLSLFFIDKVANYRVDPDSPGDQGKFAKAFELAFETVAKRPEFRNLPVSTLPARTVHAGYFSRDKKGFKDSKEGRETAADEDTFSLIMREKERLLSPEEPVQFIFSHSALREGWDNPNVFQICTLNETHSPMKKRQEIGRGLRIPVDHSGKRVFDEALNQLHVVANESYEDFAKKLQKEYEDDAGVVFGRVTIEDLVRVVRLGEGGNRDIATSEARKVAYAIQVSLREAEVIDSDDKVDPELDLETLRDAVELPEGYEEMLPAVVDLLVECRLGGIVRRAEKRDSNPVKKEVFDSPEFKAMWKAIRPRTTYALDFDTDVDRIAGMVASSVSDIKPPKISAATARLQVKVKGVEGEVTAVGEQEVDMTARPVQDVLSYLQDGTDLTRSTLLEILSKSGTLRTLLKNPQAYLDRVVNVIGKELGQLLESGIKYERLVGPDDEVLWHMEIFPDELPVDSSDTQRVVRVSKSVYQYIPCDSDIEVRFARGLDARDDITLFMKLPRDFKIDTPVGRYNPDWAVVKKNGQTLLLVRETKGTRNLDKLPYWQEKTKVLCGEKHFDLLGVDYAVAVEHTDVQ
jgi:type III restriction enzyme